MIETSTRCPRCSTYVILNDVHGFWTAVCPHCIDPESHFGQLQGKGSTPEDALEDWWQSMDESDEPSYQPSALASFIVPRGPEGFVLSPDREEPARLFFDSLSDAERNPELGPLYYGPMSVLKAANDT